MITWGLKVKKDYFYCVCFSENIFYCIETLPTCTTDSFRHNSCNFFPPTPNFVRSGSFRAIFRRSKFGVGGVDPGRTVWRVADNFEKTLLCNLLFLWAQFLN